MKVLLSDKRVSALETTKQRSMDEKEENRTTSKESPFFVVLHEYLLKFLWLFFFIRFLLFLIWIQYKNYRMNTILYYILEERRILFKDLLLSLETRYSNGNAFLKEVPTWDYVNMRYIVEFYYLFYQTNVSKRKPCANSMWFDCFINMNMVACFYLWIEHNSTLMYSEPP